MADAGMTIYAPGDRLVADLQAIGATMLENWEADASEAARAILTEYRGE